mgnify:CR=1 FL=1
MKSVVGGRVGLVVGCATNTTTNDERTNEPFRRSFVRSSLRSFVTSFVRPSLRCVALRCLAFCDACVCSFVRSFVDCWLFVLVLGGVEFAWVYVYTRGFSCAWGRRGPLLRHLCRILNASVMHARMSHKRRDDVLTFVGLVD